MAKLTDIAHRAYPPPTTRPALAQTWRDLLFAHWPVPVEMLRPLIPDALQIDTYDGMGWVGVVPFLMTGVRLRPLPAVPGTSRFPELNVRTYVTDGTEPGSGFFASTRAIRSRWQSHERGITYRTTMPGCACASSATRSTTAPNVPITGANPRVSTPPIARRQRLRSVPPARLRPFSPSDIACTRVTVRAVSTGARFIILSGPCKSQKRTLSRTRWRRHTASPCPIRHHSCTTLAASTLPRGQSGNCQVKSSHPRPRPLAEAAAGEGPGVRVTSLSLRP